MQEIKPTSFEELDTITLQSTTGEDIEFLNVAGIMLDSGYFLILQPTTLIEGMSEEEALVFSVTLDANGEEKYSIVLDDDVINEVFNEYYRLLDAQETLN